MKEIISFCNTSYIPDAQVLANTYADYKNIGRGYGNLLAFGVFDVDATGTNLCSKRGMVANGSTSVQAVDVNAITEQVTNSWYKDSSNNLNPASGVTSPVDPARKHRPIPG